MTFAALNMTRTDMTLDEAIVSLRPHLENSAVDDLRDFSFRWAGMAFRGSLLASLNAPNEITLTARLGMLPFSAEDAGARKDVLDALSQHFRSLEGTYRVTERGEIQCTAITTFDGAVRADRVVECMVVTLLHLRDVLGRFKGLLIPVV